MNECGLGNVHSLVWREQEIAKDYISEFIAACHGLFMYVEKKYACNSFLYHCYGGGMTEKTKAIHHHFL